MSMRAQGRLECLPPQCGANCAAAGVCQRGDRVVSGRARVGMVFGHWPVLAGRMAGSRRQLCIQQLQVVSQAD